MSSPRFYVPDGLGTGRTVVLPPQVAHHARRVLRLPVGAPVVLFDGNGSEFQAHLAADPLNASGSVAHVQHGGPVDREAHLRITLIQALCAQEKIDWLLEKSVELGVDHVLLAPAARSVVRLDGARAQRRLGHWREILVAACGQCGRNRLPAITLSSDLEQAMRAAPASSARWILDPAAQAGMPAPPAASVPIWLIVGPEGGFTDRERHLAHDLGFLGVRLGRRVLRTETAGLVAMAALLALAGDLT